MRHLESMRSRPNSSAKADQCTKEWTVKKQFFSWFLSTQKTGRSAPSAVPTGKSSLRATKEHWAQQMIVRHSSPRSHHISSIGPRDFRSRDFRSWLFSILEITLEFHIYSICFHRTSCASWRGWLVLVTSRYWFLSQHSTKSIIIALILQIFRKKTSL